MPVRVKSLNMVNEAVVFDAIYAIMSRFLKEKMKKRVGIVLIACSTVSASLVLLPSASTPWLEL